MRILMANKFLYPYGGGETYMISLAEALRVRGHDIAFFGMEHELNVTWGDICTVPHYDFDRRNSAAKLFMNIGRRFCDGITSKAKRTLNEFVGEWNPDIIHAHNVYNQLQPSLFETVHRQGVPTVITLHDYKILCPNYILYTKERRCYRCLKNRTPLSAIWYRCSHGKLLNSLLSALNFWYHDLRKTYQRDYDAFIAPSSFLRSKFVEKGFKESRLYTVNNFCLKPAGDDVQKVVDGNYILFAGRIEKMKGLQTIIEAYAKWDMRNKPKIIVAGTGSYVDELQIRVEELGLNNQVQWIGRVDPSRIRELLCHCSCTVAPSIWDENCSMSIIESLSAGKPCIASDTGGNPELVKHGVSGLIFRAGDVDAALTCLALLFSDDELRRNMGQTARCDAAQRFSAETHVDNVMEIYKRLTEKAKYGD